MKAFFNKLNENPYRISTVVFILVILPVVCFGMTNISFQQDSLYTIGFISKDNSLMDMMHIFVTDEVTNPPLYDLFLYFWYRIVPSNEIWLLIPNLIMFIVAYLAIIKVLFEITSSDIAVFIATCITWLGYFRMKYLVYNLRSYSMLFMFSAIAALLYYKRLKNEKISLIITYGIVLTLSGMTHYFGVITAASYVITDLILFIRKKISVRCFCSYFIIIVTIIPYLYVCLLHKNKDLSSFWGDKSTLITIAVFLAANLGNAIAAIVIFPAVSLYFYKFIRKNGLRNFGNNLNDTIQVVFVLNIIVTFLLPFIYSILFNSSIFVRYYFTSIVSQIIIISSISVSNVMGLIKKTYFSLSYSALIILSMIFGGVGFHNLYEAYFQTTYTRNMADYINAEEDYDRDSAIYVLGGKGNQWNVPRYPVKGLKEFYLRDNDIDIIDKTEMVSNYQRVYVWWYMFRGHKKDNMEEICSEANEDMEGYHIVHNDPQTGMLVYERDN